MKIKEAKKEDRVDVVPRETFEKIYNEVHENFESIRADIYVKVMDCTLSNENEAREIMQKGYITFSTISTFSKKERAAVRSKWADQVASISSKHSAYIQ